MKQKLGLLVALIIFLAILGWAFYPKPFDVDVAEIHVGNFERTIEESGKTRLRDRYGYKRSKHFRRRDSFPALRMI